MEWVAMWNIAGSVRLAVAAVFAFFGFLVAFFIVSDRLGGGAVGSGVAFVVAAVVFLFVSAIAPRSTQKQVGTMARGEPVPAPTMVQPLVHVNVPVEVHVEGPGVADTRETIPKLGKPDMPPPPSSVTSQDATVESKDKPSASDSPRFEEMIFEGTVEVNPGREGAWSFELPIQIGDIIEGNLRETDLETFTWMIMNEKNLSAYLNGDEIDVAAGEDNVKATPIHWRCSKKGRWHLVLDAYGKWYAREVHIILRRIRVP